MRPSRIRRYIEAATKSRRRRLPPSPLLRRLGTRPMYVKESDEEPTKMGRRRRLGMRRMLLVLPLIVLLAGCAHYYTKPGATPAGFSRDKQECERIAKVAAERNRTRECDEVERCLFSKGWRRD